jgi:heme/copper-type cytochrome/quinol oxidase subunit 2
MPALREREAGLQLGPHKVIRNSALFVTAVVLVVAVFLVVAIARYGDRRT